MATTTPNRKSSTARKSSNKPKAASSPAKPKTPRERFANWPTKGYDGPQPWDHKQTGADVSELGDGQRDDVSAVDPRPGLPILASGSAGEGVRELGQRLSDIGYDNSIAHGDNPFSIADESVMAAVERFMSDYGVEEAPSEAIGGNTDAGRRQRAAHVGPYTLEAIYRVSDRERAA